ncbi:MAG: hypothetical protein AB1442_11825 [Nitrospirota bacterium]
MALLKDEIVALYRKRAGYYDFTANLYYLMGFREQAYRKKALRMLNLKNGDTVVEIGCGTGLNLPMCHPWESIKKYLKNTSLAEFYLGFVYIATGERGEQGC